MKKFLDTYFKFLKIVLTVLMGVLIIPVTMQIFSRYVGFIPRYIWTEELARFLFHLDHSCWRDDRHAVTMITFTVDLLPTPKSK